MSTPTGMPSSGPPTNDLKSPFDRVRVHMNRLIHSGRGHPVPVQGRPVVTAPEQRTAAPEAAAAATAVAIRPDMWLPLLDAELYALEQILAEGEDLLRQAWNVAADLNQMRRRCSRCEEVGMLTEAAGTLQGILNQCRHELRGATRAIANIKGVVSTASSEP